MKSRAPKQKAPPLSCDCHFHIFGPFGRYPMSEGRTYTPPEALVPAYLELAAIVGLQRMVVVQASIYGTDNAVTLDAIKQFGLHRARGVAVIDDCFDSAALRRLHEQGIRGVRFNMVSGNGTPEDQLEALARRVAPLGWHIQIYAEGAKMLEIGPLLARLPVEIVVDHCGGVKAELGIQHPQFQALDGQRPGLDEAVQLSCLVDRGAVRGCGGERENSGGLGARAVRLGNRLATFADESSARGRPSAGPIPCMGPGCTGATAGAGGQRGAAIRFLRRRLCPARKARSQSR